MESFWPEDKLLPYSAIWTNDDHPIRCSARRPNYVPPPSSTRTPIVSDARNRIVQLMLQQDHPVCHHAVTEYVSPAAFFDFRNRDTESQMLRLSPFLRVKPGTHKGPILVIPFSQCRASGSVRKKSGLDVLGNFSS